MSVTAAPAESEPDRRNAAVRLLDAAHLFLAALGTGVLVLSMGCQPLVFLPSLSEDCAYDVRRHIIAAMLVACGIVTAALVTRTVRRTRIRVLTALLEITAVGYWLLLAGNEPGSLFR